MPKRRIFLIGIPVAAVVIVVCELGLRLNIRFC